MPLQLFGAKVIIIDGNLPGSLQQQLAGFCTRRLTFFDQHSLYRRCTVIGARHIRHPILAGVGRARSGCPAATTSQRDGALRKGEGWVNHR